MASVLTLTPYLNPSEAKSGTRSRRRTEPVQLQYPMYNSIIIKLIEKTARRPSRENEEPFLKVSVATTFILKLYIIMHLDDDNGSHL